MALTQSNAMALGSKAPEFALPDPSGKVFQLVDFTDRPVLVIAFICNHCPYVKHLKQALSSLAKDVMAQGGAVVAINSNDASAYPDDSPERMAEDIETFDYRFPYLVDASQDVARSYGAVCTPEFFVFDGSQALSYCGQFDDSRPGSGQATGADIRAAVDAVLDGSGPLADQKPSVGCSIKWKSV